MPMNKLSNWLTTPKQNSHTENQSQHLNKTYANKLVTLLPL